MHFAEISRRPAPRPRLLSAPAIYPHVSWNDPQEYILRVIWPRETPRDRAAVVIGIRPYFDAGWFNYPKYYAQDLLVVVVRFDNSPCSKETGRETQTDCRVFIFICVR